MTQRRGFTLIEILIALVIMGIVTGALYRLLNTSQRLTLAQSEQVSLQSNVRAGSLVVPSELRELNTVVGAGVGPQNDILDAQLTSVQYRAMRGMGFTCQAPAAPVNVITLTSSSWTGLRTPKLDRDSLYLFVDGDPNDEADDSWQHVAITGVATTANACGAGVAGIVLNVAAVAPAAEVPAVPLNTPVRIFEVMELKLYQDNGEWWMGARSVKPEAALKPVLGPLTTTGLDFRYLNSAGAETADMAAIKSVRLTVRGLTSGAVRAGGFGATGRQQEELVTQVLLRNSIRP